MMNTSQTVPLEKLMKSKHFCKMMFLCNSLEDGWVIKKKNDHYVLTKQHDNRKEFFDDNYTELFLEHNFQWKESLAKIAQEIRNN